MSDLGDLVSFTEQPDGSVAIEAMGYPMRCKWCRRVHDAMGVDVVQRYADCSVWRCPHCGVLGDDRPLSWGGSFERVSA